MTVNHEIICRLNEIWQAHALDDVERTVLPKMVEFVSPHLEKQADTALRIRTHYSATQHAESQTEANGANWAGRHRVSVDKFCLPSLNYCVFLIIDFSAPPSESPFILKEVGRTIALFHTLPDTKHLFLT
jgi:hypothetical protein